MGVQDCSGWPAWGGGGVWEALLPSLLSFTSGLVAQLGDYLPGIHEAVGSIPSIR